MKNLTSKKQLREFGILIGIGFPFFIGFLIPWFTGHEFRTWTLFIAVPSLLLSFIAPRSLANPYKIWMRIGTALGWFNSRLILGIIFIVVLI